MRTILLISPYWKEPHRWMVSSVKLAELWQRLGYRVVVVCMGSSVVSSSFVIRPDERRATKQRVTIEHVSGTLEIHRFPDFFLTDPWNYGIAFGFSGYVGRLAERIKPDLIVVNKILFWSSLATIALRLKGHRVILLTDALVGMTWMPRGFLPRLGARLYAWTVGWLILRCANQVVFFHPQPEGLLRFLGIVRKSQVIPTGIDVDRHSSVRHSSNDQRRTDERRTRVTYIGRLESVKGVDDFLAAATVVRLQHPSLQIQVIGWHAPNHPLVARYWDQVNFTGLRDDIPSILAATDIFVLPSHSEGLSNALMEAMASGCACIASDVGGNRFLIQNGVSGFLFPPGDREALAAHIRRLIDDPAKRRMLGEQARKRIEERFEWKRVGGEYRKLFDGEMKDESGKRKVVILSTFLLPFRSGAEACAEEISKRLSDKFEITIVTARLSRSVPRCSFFVFGFANKKRTTNNEQRNSVKIVRIGLGNHFDKWLYPFLAPFAVRRGTMHRAPTGSPIVIHGILETFAGLALFVCRWIVPNAKRILTLQTTNRSFFKGSIVRSPDRVTAISQALKNIAAEFGRSDVEVIPNGIDLDAIHAARERKIKIPGRILFVGRLEEMKGVDVLLQAFESLLQATSYPTSPRLRGASQLSASLRIVGNGSLRSKLKAQSSNLGIDNHVTFTGFIPTPQVYDEFASAEIFCALSRSEALGNVFLEAQAAGCAVIGTKVGGIPEIIEDGRTGLLVPADDHLLAQHALQRLLTDSTLRERLAEEGRKNAERYDWGVVAQLYGNLYQASDA